MLLHKPHRSSASLLQAILFLGLALSPSAALAALPTGGTITTFLGNGSTGTSGVMHRVHTFTGNGSFDTGGVALFADYQVVAGGGGGGSPNEYASCGGGGGGEFLRRFNQALSSGLFSVAIGTGGGKGTAGGASGTNGGNSTFGDIQTRGGGGGGCPWEVVGSTGGSGGGSARDTASGGLSSKFNGDGLGNNGGLSGGQVNSTSGAGGGGGAGGVGANAPTNTAGGNGGAGIDSNFSGTSVNYAAGGGGGYRQAGEGPGDAGGASASRGALRSGNALNASANRGGGGGGGTYNDGTGSSLRLGGDGGSGIVLVRYTLHNLAYQGNSNTSGTAPSSETGVPDGTAAPSAGDLAKTGYLFSGWNTESDGDGTHYRTGEAMNLSSASTTLYAQWADIIVSTSTLSVAEDEGVNTFTVVLTHAPVSNVVLDVVSGSLPEATVSPATLTFTPSNWSIPQTVTVTGVDDDSDTASNDSATITVSVDDTLSDDTYDPFLGKTVEVTLADDDTAGFTITPIDSLTGESSPVGGSGEFSIVMNSKPSAGVSLALSSSDTSEGTVQSSVSFTADNWSTPQSVAVNGVDDVLGDGAIAYSIVTGAVTSSDPIYGAMDGSAIDDVAMVNQNDDPPGIALSVTENTTEAGGTTAVRFWLLSQPADGADVTIPLSIDDATEGSLGGITSITILNANWNIPASNEVTVTGVDDLVADGDVAYALLTGDPTSSDSGYGSLGAGDVANPVLINEDNDSVGITLSKTSASVTEGGATDSYTIVLNTEPSADVSISITDGSEVTVSPSTLTFTSGDWNVPQAVTITAIDDLLLDGVTTGTTVIHTISSLDLNYAVITAADVSVAVADNDYEVSYHANGSDLGTIPSSQIKSTGVDLALRSNTGNLVKTGYAFSGWNTAANGSGTHYDEGENLVTAATAVLYADWAPNSYSLSFEGNGSTGGSMTSQSYVYDVVQAISSNAFSRTGYNFSSWNTAADGSGSQYSDGQSISNLAVDDGDTVTLYAQWTVPAPDVSEESEESESGSSSPSRSSGSGGRITYCNPEKGITAFCRQKESVVTDSVEAAVGNTLSSSCSVPLYLTREVRYGAVNNPDDVRLLERFLNTYEDAGVPVDGVYSAMDRDAVIAWQEKHHEDVLKPWGLTEGTGLISTKSLAKIKQIHQAGCTTDSSSVSPVVVNTAQCFVHDATLFPGEERAQVKSLQETLQRLDYIPASTVLTGYFGPATLSGVKSFQGDNGIMVTGNVGPLTGARLQAMTCR